MTAVTHQIEVVDLVSDSDSDSATVILEDIVKDILARRKRCRANQTESAQDAISGEPGDLQNSEEHVGDDRHNEVEEDESEDRYWECAQRWGPYLDGSEDHHEDGFEDRNHDFEDMGYASASQGSES